MQPRLSLSIFPVLAMLAACGDDIAADPTGTACTITERVRLAAPPEGWAHQAGDDYMLYRFPDFVLYSFDDRDDPARLFWRLDPCTGETTPFPSLAPGLGNVFLVDTAVGRVLYASDEVRDYYVVDRVDEPHLINGSAELMKALLWPMLATRRDLRDQRLAEEHASQPVQQEEAGDVGEGDVEHPDARGDHQTEGPDHQIRREVVPPLLAED